MSTGSSRWAPLTGVAFAVLTIIAIFVIGGEPPDVEKDSARELVDYYKENKGKVIAGSALEAITATLLVFFGGSLRRVLRAAEGPNGVLSAVAFAGLIILAAGLAIDGSISFGLAETSGEIDPVATQALSALFSYDFLVFALGGQLFLLAMGISLVRHGALPKWIGWVAIPFGVIAVTPLGFISLLVLVVLVLVMSVILIMRGRAAPQAA